MTTELTAREQIRALVESTDTIIAEWLAFEKAEGASYNTLAAYRKGLNVFTAWLRESNATPQPGPEATPRLVPTNRPLDT